MTTDTDARPGCDPPSAGRLVVSIVLNVPSGTRRLTARADATTRHRLRSLALRRLEYRPSPFSEAGTTFEGYSGVPDPVLDIEPALSGSSAGAISAAEADLRELNSSPPRLTVLEGMATKRLALAVVFPKFDQKAREVLNNARAMERAIDLAKRPDELGLSDIQPVHALLAEGTHLAPWAGRLRDEPGWIGGATPADASYVPPPEEHLERLLGDLVASSMTATTSRQSCRRPSPTRSSRRSIHSPTATAVLAAARPELDPTLPRGL